MPNRKINSSGFKKLADQRLKELTKNPALSDAAVADLLRSGITKVEALALGMRDPVGSEILGYCGQKLGAYIIPYGDTGFARAKFLDPWIPKGETKPRKYGQKRGTQPRLYTPSIGNVDFEAVAKNAAIPIVIVEGEKKAAAAAKAGLPCIGLGGVDCWRTKAGAIKDWDAIVLVGRPVCIGFDSDIADKPNIQQAELALAMFLEERGATVKRVRLPSLPDCDKTGLDDFLVHHGLPKDIEKARQAFLALPQEACDLEELGKHLNEVDNAVRFAALHQDCLRYVYDWKRWLKLNPASGLWAVDKTGEELRCAEQTLDVLRQDILKIKNGDVKKNLLNNLSRCKTAKHMKAIVEIAAAKEAISIESKSLDAALFDVALPDGRAFHLKTMEIHAVASEDYFTKHIGVVFDPAAKCPRWERFLMEIFNGDRELIAFVKRAVGYCLTGDTREQCIFVCFGTGANGKSTFLEILLKLLGGYGMECAPETFMVRRNQTNTRDDLLRLQSARCIVTSELEENERLAEALIKRWTGGDGIVTRGIYKTDLDFKPQGKLWIGTNHKPRIYGTDFGIWRRMRLICFGVSFPESKRDTELTQKLMAELSGILNWALAGCAEWLRDGLKPPASVLEATQAYKSEMDVLGSWINECCMTGDDCKVLIATAYSSYVNWIKDAGEPFTLSKREFSKRMEERKFARKQTTDRSGAGKGWFLIGIKLTAEQNPKLKGKG